MFILQDFADAHGLVYAETSAKSAAGVTEAFRLVFSLIVADDEKRKRQVMRPVGLPPTAPATTAEGVGDAAKPQASSVMPSTATSQVSASNLRCHRR